MVLWPTAEQERAGAWRSMRWWVAALFFFFTLQAVSALYGFSTLLSLPAGWITGIASIGIGELLIQRWRLWRTGVENALWLAGPCAFIVSLPSTGKPEALLAFAAAAAVAGWRLRNGLFGTIAIILVTVYLRAREWPWPSVAFALLVALIALAALTRTWQRPSTEFLWQAIVILLPITAYIVVLTFDMRHFVSNPVVSVLFLVLAAIFMMVGIRFLIRVPLVASLIAITIAVIEAHDFISLSLEAALIVFGAIAFAIAAALMRALRGRTTGFVTDVRKSELDAVMDVAPALLAVQASAPAAEGGGPHPGGGEFGGAGASGQF